MNQKIKGIIEGRKLAGKYHQNLVSFKKAKRILNSANHTTLVAEFEAQLKAIGFESIADFYEQNRLACLAEVERCYQAVGECDCCEGRERGCLKDCFPNRSKAVNRVTFLWQDFYDWKQFEGHSPEGCSMHFEKVEKPSFDIYWGMPEGLKPEVVRRFNRGISNT
jgi:hypothetical protein